MQQQPMMAAYYPNNVTTDHIQQYLDENKSLILRIVENQNSGKLSECAENQARLQRNLMYLAAIADSQPNPPTMHSQYSSGVGILPSGAHYMQQHPQQAQLMTTPQSVMAAQRSSPYYGGAHHPYSSLHAAAAASGHLGMSSSSGGGGAVLLAGEPHAGGFPEFIRGDSMGLGGRGLGGGNKQEGGSSEGRGGLDAALYLKRGGDEGN